MLVTGRTNKAVPAQFGDRDLISGELVLILEETPLGGFLRIETLDGRHRFHVESDSVDLV